MKRTDSKKTSTALGHEFETMAEHYLVQRGLQCIVRNFSVARGQGGSSGEIDLIMRERDTLVFVEVRQRQSDQFGSATTSITLHKQHKLIRTAHYYLQRFRDPPPCRFDVIAIDGVQVDWIKNAFTA